MMALGISGNSFGMHMATAAYSPEGAEWVDGLMRYLDGNRKLFDEGMAAIPGLRSMPLEATYLAWLDFSGTGMAAKEFIGRVEREAKIATTSASQRVNEWAFVDDGQPHRIDIRCAATPSIAVGQ